VLDAWSPPLLSVFRVVAALLYMLHGTQKLFGVPPTASGATVDLASRMGAAGVIELAGGLLILPGLFTRPAAFICAGEMALAFFPAHAPRGLLPNTSGGELPEPGRGAATHVLTVPDRRG
jgi:putative oxidoreductase